MSETSQKAKRLLSEFVIIVFGVLAALGVDEWRGIRQDRLAERQYVQRLIADLVRDSATSARGLTGYAEGLGFGFSDRPDG